MDDEEIMSEDLSAITSHHITSFVGNLALGRNGIAAFEPIKFVEMAL